MKKENGRTARPGTSAELKMGGTIHLALTPDDIQKIVAGEETVLELDEGMEFILQIEPAKENKIIELTPWFDLDDAILTIENSVHEDNPSSRCNNLADYVTIHLIESEKRELGFSVNRDQARAIATALFKYAQIWDAIDALCAEPVRA